jgi:protein gp37
MDPKQPTLLTATERAELAQLEKTIRHGRLAIGRALKRICDARLYREEYPTFEDYCRSRWQISRQCAYEHIRAAEVAGRLEEEGIETPPGTRPAHLLPLRDLDAATTASAWERAQETAGERMTATHAKRAVREVTGVAEPAPSLDELIAGWSKEARRALKKTKMKHRFSIAETLNDLGVEIDDVSVAEAIEGYNAAVLEDGLTMQAKLVGDAAALADTSESSVAGSNDQPIAELDILDEEQVHQADEKRKVYFTGSAEKRPLLISVPRIIAPAQVTGDIPADVRQVIMTLDEYERMGGPVKGGVLDVAEFRAMAREAGRKLVFQRTNEHVDWARFTTNPLTGCWHSCRSVFCYAAGIAQRLFAQGFIPTLLPARLDHFRNTRLPDVSGLGHVEAWRERSVFMVSMGDLFGSWVPSWYVELVLEEVRQHPGWFCFFLTKNPARLGDFSFPPNCAVGLTITGDDNGFNGPMTPTDQLRVYEKLAEKLGRVQGAAFTWLSLEPFRAPVHDLAPFFDNGVQMVAIGGQSRTSFSPAFQPEIQWVDNVRGQVRDAGLNLFEKENLLVKPKEIPFPADPPNPAPKRRGAKRAADRAPIPPTADKPSSLTGQEKE